MFRFQNKPVSYRWLVTSGSFPRLTFPLWLVLYLQVFWTKFPNSSHWSWFESFCFSTVERFYTFLECLNSFKFPKAGDHRNLPIWATTKKYLISWTGPPPSETLYLTYFLTFYLTCSLAFYLEVKYAALYDVNTGILPDAFQVAYYLTFHLVIHLAFHLAFYMTVYLAVYLA